MTFYTNSGLTNLLTNKDVVEYIRMLLREAENPRNDGWVQKGYRDRIDEIKDIINKFNHKV